MFYRAIIFITGGVILSLELLSSRILNPYFGVSLYIWAGILSVTLIALALGYHWGGTISERGGGRGMNRRSFIEYHFLLMPAESSISMGFACILYPFLFFDLARANLVFGAFFASLVMLFIPLFSMSAMNTLLIAMNSSGKGSGEADNDHAGYRAGHVFFISTAGSVAGVLTTAFLFIPNMTNYSSVLVLGVCLAGLSMAACVRSDALTAAQKKKVLVVSICGFVLCGLLLAFSPVYLKKDVPVSYGGHRWRIEKEYTSVFGNIKVLSMDEEKVYYSHDGDILSLADGAGRSISPYTYGMEALALWAKPGMESSLVVGLAGGLIPMRLAERGISTEVVEINPDSLDAAKRFFHFDESSVKTHLMDVRIFVRDCPRRYESILVDLPYGISAEYLFTKEFYRDIKGCLVPDGLLVVNTLGDRRFDGQYYPIIKTLKSVFKTVAVFHEDEPPAAWPFTVYVAVTDADHISAVDVRLDDVPEQYRGILGDTFKEPKPIDERLLESAEVITDEYNFYPFINAGFQLAFRRALLSFPPPVFLVN